MGTFAKIFSNFVEWINSIECLFDSVRFSFVALPNWLLIRVVAKCYQWANYKIVKKQNVMIHPKIDDSFSGCIVSRNIPPSCMFWAIRCFCINGQRTAGSHGSLWLIWTATLWFLHILYIEIVYIARLNGCKRMSLRAWLTSSYASHFHSTG